MNKQFLHILQDSFRAFFENRLQQGGRSFRNVSGQLYQTPCEYPGKYAYSNPYGQWIYDLAVSGAQVPSGVYVNGNFTPRGTNGLILDYINGRAIFDSPQSNVTAVYSVKDFNIYTTSRSDEQLVFDDKLRFRPKFNNIPVTGIPPNSTYGPLIYIKRDYASNEPFALGGQDNTITNYRAIILTDNEYDLDGVGSIFMDAARENFMLLSGVPLNRYNDINGLYYNYREDVISNYNNTNMVYISDVDYYRFDARTETSINYKWYAGFIEFTLELPRYPRVNTNTTIQPPADIMLYYQTIDLPSGVFSYDVVFAQGSNLIDAEIVLPNSASGIYQINYNNISLTGFTAIFDYIYETGISLRVTTSD